jgi:orotate phosphoribosyltransferase-like protein
MQLQKNGITVTKMANSLNVTTMAIYYVLRGRLTSKRIESTLEAVFGMPISDIRTAWNNKGKPVLSPEIKQAFEKFGVKAAV